MYDAFEIANDIIKEKVSKDKGNIFIILVTDGFLSINHGSEKALSKLIKEKTIPILKSNGKFCFKCIGIGVDINHKFLDELEKLFKC